MLLFTRRISQEDQLEHLQTKRYISIYTEPHAVKHIHHANMVLNASIECELRVESASFCNYLIRFTHNMADVQLMEP